MDVTALLPMKGHSARVPGKNIRVLAGRPAFYWMMKALEGSRHVKRVVVNTDSEEIAEVVLDLFPNTIILRRPDHLLGDKVPMQPLIEHDLEHTDGDLYLQTHATNPLVRPGTVDRAIESFVEQHEHDSLFSVTALRTRLYWPDGSPVNHDPEILLPTQDLAPVYEENSCLYVFWREMFERRRHRLGERPMMFPMDPEEAVDIDEILDFRIAEALLAHRMSEFEPV
jgi:CMP-N-acetylneuraminic acid synthetase